MKVRYGPDGTHLFERNNGLNVLLENHVPATQWTFSPRQVSIALTNSCNLFCPHCYAPKTYAVLSKDKVIRWVQELDKAGSFGVGFGGGEPTLYPQLIEVCDFVRHNTELAVTMTTHGLNLTNGLVNELKDKLHFLRISMDGVGETYRSIRGRSFEYFLSKLKLVSGTIPFGINYVVNDKTVSDLNNAASIVEDYGASELLLLPEEPVGKGVKISDSALHSLHNWILNYQGSLKLTLSAFYEKQLNGINPLTKESPEYAYAHIDAEGRIKKTSFDKSGIRIDSRGVMRAFNRLLKLKNEDLV